MFACVSGCVCVFKYNNNCKFWQKIKSYYNNICWISSSISIGWLHRRVECARFIGGHQAPLFHWKTQFKYRTSALYYSRLKRRILYHAHTHKVFTQKNSDKPWPQLTRFERFSKFKFVLLMNEWKTNNNNENVTNSDLA